MATETTKFGELLRRLRGSRSQREIAADLDMPVTTLSGLENQGSVPRGAVLKRIADYYGVPLTYFYQPPTSEMKPSDSARSWLASLRRDEAPSNTIATHAPPEYPDEVKRRFAQLIRQRKNGQTPGRQ